MKMTKKLLIIMISAVIALSAAVGTTLAYLLSQTPEVENSFIPVYVKCEVVEDFTGSVKSNVAVKNTGHINAYVRSTYVVMWVADDGSVYGTAPKEGVDYTVNFGSPSWDIGSDGFYYYSLPVSPNSTTEVLISSLSAISEPPEGYHLTVHVAATAIQAEPADAIESAWGATVHTNGAVFAP